MQIKNVMVLIDRTRITCLHTSKNSTTCPTDMRTSILTIIVEGGLGMYINSTSTSGLPLLWNQREKWLLFQVLTKEKWETTNREKWWEYREKSKYFSNCTTFHIRGALSWHSYAIMYLLCIKVYSVVV